MTERRRFERHALHKQVAVRMPDHERVNAWTVDVSSGGCRLRLPRPASIGTFVHVEMLDGEGLTLATQGRVRHMVTMGAAIVVGVQWIGA